MHHLEVHLDQLIDYKQLEDYLLLKNLKLCYILKYFKNFDKNKTLLIGTF